MKRLMKKKVNVFGKSVPVFAIAILSVALVSAALVPYISNVVIGSFSVDHPFELKISNDSSTWENSIALGSVHGGENVTFYLQATNNLNDKLNTKIVATIKNSIHNVTCEDFSNVYINGNNTDPKPMYNGSLLGSGFCVEDAGIVNVTLPADYLANEVEVYDIVLTFALNVDPANYEVTTGGKLP